MKSKLTWLLMLFMAFSIQLSFAQNKKITGAISDSNNLPLAGVTIIVDGTRKGVVSNFDGEYTISAKTSDVLKFSYVGMQTQFVTVGDTSTINIVMVEDVESLDAVVVTGYQNIKRELFTGASQTIKAEEIKLDGVADISRALEGRAAGVSVQNVTGTFGAAPRITIRGSSSILGDTKPIWIIDGVIQEEIVNISASDLVSGDPNTLLSSAVAGLNASDIQSFEILRDASATALYGARALNGVIVITTKTGRKNQKPTFSYGAEFAIRDIPRYTNYDLLNSQETVSVYRELESKGFLDLPDSFQNRYGGIYNIMYRAINNFDETTGQYQLENTPEARANFLQQFELANVALDYIRNNPDYTLYSFDNSISICFNYKDIDPVELCTALYEHQETVVGFGSFKEDTFVRFVTINANNEKEQILNFFKVLENFVANTPSLHKSSTLKV